MDIDIKELAELAKAAASGFDLSDFKGDVVGFKYVENEIGNVEQGGIGVQYVSGKKADNATPHNKPATKEPVQTRERKLMTFKKKNITDGHLTVLFMKLAQEGWIEGDEESFKSLFFGKNANCVIVWTGKVGKSTLLYLFKQLIKEGFIELKAGFTVAHVLEDHFKNKEGVWLSGLDKGDAPNKKAMPVVEECLSIMRFTPDNLLDSARDMSNDYADDYDRFDTQDMRLHRRR